MRSSGKAVPVESWADFHKAQEKILTNVMTLVTYQMTERHLLIIRILR